MENLKKECSLILEKLNFDTDLISFIKSEKLVLIQNLIIKIDKIKELKKRDADSRQTNLFEKEQNLLFD